MSEIRACVSERILQTVDRMFTGDVSGRITELLQNSRRAGAEHVWITRRKANDTEWIIEMEDDGCGIDDFSTLLNAGKTDWNQATQQSEDPAGMGLFCLAPRTLTIYSNGKTACIEGDGWRGAPVKVLDTDVKVKGTKLIFKDAAWEHNTLTSCSRYSGLRVKAGGDRDFLHSEPFTSPTWPYSHLKKLGVRIQKGSDNQWDDLGHHANYGTGAVYINFHGQTIFERMRDLVGERPLSSLARLRVGVDLTGEPTDLKMILPARTGLVHNKARDRLGIEIEKAVYERYASQRSHDLAVVHWERAKELGIDIGEASPRVVLPFHEGDTFHDYNHVDVGDPVVTEDTKFTIEDVEGNLIENGEDLEDDKESLILRLLNIQGIKVAKVTPGYERYSWADGFVKLERVSINIGEDYFEGEVQGSTLCCVADITFKAEFSDGRVEEGDLPFSPDVDGEVCSSWDSQLAITPVGIKEAPYNLVWLSIGGWDEETDWDTAQKQFEEEYEDFCDQLIGPNEASRRRIFDKVQSNLWGLEGGADRQTWEKVEVDSKGNVKVFYEGDHILEIAIRKD